MLSKSQQIEKEENIKKVVEAFLSSDVSINELSKMINISSSTIQRYLNDVDYITMIFGSSAKEKLMLINAKLKANKQKGHSKGGIISTTNNEPIRDENGKFTGNRKK